MIDPRGRAGSKPFLDGEDCPDSLRAVIEAAPVSLVVVDERGLIVAMNEATEELFGYRREELLGDSIERLMPERFRSGHRGLRAAFAAAPSSRAMGAGRELYGLRRDGTEVQVEIGLRPMGTSGGGYVLAAISDVTERRRAESLRISNAAMLEQNARLTALNEELESFSYTVSHDLRAPIRAISGYAHALHEDYGGVLDEEGQRLLSVVRSEAGRLGRLIDHLLGFSHLGRRVMDESLTDMTALALGAVPEAVQDAGAERVDVQVATLPSAVGDRTLLRQVWVNLICNAVKYARAGVIPRVRVTGELEGSKAVYHVADDGIGFDMKYADKLFGVFQRLHHGDEFSGSGIGLAIVARIVVRHGGSVWAEGRPGEGATFSFALPAGEAR